MAGRRNDDNRREIAADELDEFDDRDHVDDQRDPGATPEEAGVPDTADDQATASDVPEPQKTPMPVDEPGASDEHSTTDREQLEGEPLESRLKQEEPDVAEVDRAKPGSRGIPGEGRPGADTGYRVDDDRS